MTIKSLILTAALLLAGPHMLRADDAKGAADDASREWSPIEVVYFCNLPLAEAKIENCTAAQPKRQRQARLRKKVIR